MSGKGKGKTWPEAGKGGWKGNRGKGGRQVPAGKVGPVGHMEKAEAEEARTKESRKRLENRLETMESLGTGLVFSRQPVAVATGKESKRKRTRQRTQRAEKDGNSKETKEPEEAQGELVQDTDVFEGSVLVTDDPSAADG